MGFSEDLELVLARTGHARFRETTDPASSHFKPRHVEAVRRMAAEIREGRLPPPQPPRRPIATRPDELIRSCLYGDSCGCASRKCYWPTYRTVRMAVECRECMAGTVLSPPVHCQAEQE